MGKFRALTLRNVALTALHMHDGSLSTLSDVIDAYARGGATWWMGRMRGTECLTATRAALSPVLKSRWRRKRTSSRF